MIHAILGFEEGFRSRPYKCPAGFWTVGKGRNLDQNPISPQEWLMIGRPNLSQRDFVTLPMTEQEADTLLNLDITKLTPGLVKIYGNDTWASIGGLRRAVLQSMAYQMGVAGVAGFTNMNKALKSGNYAAVRKHALDSDWYLDPDHGTPERALRHATALETGEPAPEWVAYAKEHRLEV